MNSAASRKDTTSASTHEAAVPVPPGSSGARARCSCSTVAAAETATTSEAQGRPGASGEAAKSCQAEAPGTSQAAGAAPLPAAPSSPAAAPPHCGCVATHVLVNQADHHENYNRQGQPGEHARVALRPPGRDSARRTEVRPHMEGLRPLRLRGQQRGARVCGLTAGAAFGICCPHGGGRLGGSPVSTRLPSLRGGATRSTQPHPGAAHTQRGGRDGARARGAAVGPVGADALGEGRGNGSLRRVCRHHEHTFMPASQPSHVMRSACPAATLISAAGSPCCCRPSCPSPPLPHSPAPPPGSGGRR